MKEKTKYVVGPENSHVCKMSYRQPKHSDACLFFTDLMIDLKLMLVGLEPAKPIDASRLEVFREYINQVRKCDEEVKIFEDFE